MRTNIKIEIKANINMTKNRNMNDGILNWDKLGLGNKKYPWNTNKMMIKVT